MPLIEINALTADFSARSDPAQRAVIEGDRKRALSELEALKKGMEEKSKEFVEKGAEVYSKV